MNDVAVILLLTLILAAIIGLWIAVFLKLFELATPVPPMAEPQPERIGDPYPVPPDWMLMEAESVGIGLAADRPWIPAPRPLGGKALRMGCSCLAGRLEFRRHILRSPSGDGVAVWLGQCERCQTIYWSVETGG